MLLINTHTGWANTELVVGQKSEPLQASLRITHSVRALSRSGRAGLIDESRAVRTGPFCQTFYHHLLFTHVHQLTHRTFLLNSWQPQCAGKCAGGINLRLDSLTHAQHTHTHTHAGTRQCPALMQNRKAIGYPIMSLASCCPSLRRRPKWTPVRLPLHPMMNLDITFWVDFRGRIWGRFRLRPNVENGINNKRH